MKTQQKKQDLKGALKTFVMTSKDPRSMAMELMSRSGAIDKKTHRFLSSLIDGSMPNNPRARKEQYKAHRFDVAMRLSEIGISSLKDAYIVYRLALISQNPKAGIKAIVKIRLDAEKYFTVSKKKK